MTPPRSRILIVDDDPDLVSRLSQLLEDDHEVLTSTDWGTINRIVFRDGCDLVLMDVGLPVLRGDALVRILRSTRTVIARPRIVFLSSADPEHMATLAEQVGADGWLSKSMRAQDLVAAIAKHLAARGAAEAS